MDEMRGITRLLVVAVTVFTMLVVLAVGVSASSSSFAPSKSVAAVAKTVVAAIPAINVVTNTSVKASNVNDDNGKHKGECHPPGQAKKHHHHKRHHAAPRTHAK